jgi:hypothetical protein
MTGTIRAARADDAAEIRRLVAAHAPTARVPDGDRGQLLVFDLGDSLGGVAHVMLSPDRHAALDLLVVDPSIPGLEERLGGVAHAFCQAFGADHVDTIAR